MLLIAKVMRVKVMVTMMMILRLMMMRRARDGVDCEGDDDGDEAGEDDEVSPRG